MTTLFRTPRGELIRRGTIKHEVSWGPAFGDALPGWLSAPVGTSALQTASTSTASANARVTTAAATSGSAARLLVTQAIRADQYDEIEWTLEGLRFDSSRGWKFRMDIANVATTPDRGISFAQADSPPGTVTGGAGETKAILNSYNGATVTPHPGQFQFQKVDGASQKPMNVTLLWRPKMHEVFVLQDDQVMIARKLTNPAAIATTVQPWAQMENTEAVQHSFTFARARVALRSRA